MKENKENPKNRTRRFSTDLFNARLFLEGVKRLRVIITAVAILTFAVSILVPVISWIGRAEQYERYLINEAYAGQSFEPATIEYIGLCPPLYFLPFAAPLFFLVLFSFLHKRRQSDFFHAIPYTRTCVFVSFSLAALASVSAIAILCAVLSGSVYALCPFTTFFFSELLAAVGLSILSAAFLSSFMILALSLTGTTATTLLMFALFASITRVTLGLFSLLVNMLTIVQSSFYPFLSIYWYLPFRIFVRDTFYTASTLPSYTNLVPYTVLVTLLIFSLAGLSYCRRPSEMAERSAPSRTLQAVFRSLFTLPFALLLTTLLATGDSTPSLFLVLLVITLLAFYLYELITTKRIRNLPHATPWLLAVFGGAVAFYISFVLFSSVVTADIPAKKIESISLPSTESTSYETIVTGTVKSYDERAIALISDTIRSNRSSITGTRPLTYRIITIHKTNGQTVKRGLYFTEENNQKLNEYLAESKEYSEKLLELPPLYSVDSIGFFVDGVRRYNTVHFRKGEQELKELYELLAKEYKNLSKEDQLLFKRDETPLSEKPEESSLPEYVFSEIYTPLSCTVTVSGRYEGLRYSSSYDIPEAMQSLLAYALSNLSERFDEPAYYESEYQYRSTGIWRITAHSGSYTTLDVTKAIFRDLKSGNLDFDGGHVRIAAYGDLEYSIAIAKDERRFIPFFEAIATHLESSRAPEKGMLPVIITVDRLFSDTSTDEAYAFQIIYLTEAEYKALLDTLWGAK